MYLDKEIMKYRKKKVLIMYSTGLEQKIVELPIYVCGPQQSVSFSRILMPSKDNLAECF